MPHVREKPRLDTYIRSVSPGGQIQRWAQDEPKAQNVFDELEYGDGMPGGDDQFSCTLPRKPGVAYGDLERLSTLRVEGVGGRCLGEYRLEQAPRTSGSDRSVNPKGVGWQGHLDDDKSAQEIYIDRDLSGWIEPSTQRKINQMIAGVPQRFEGNWSIGGQDAGSAVPGVVQEFTRIVSVVTVGPFATCETWYFGGGVPLGEIRYDFDNVVGIGAGDANWDNQVLLSSDDLGTAFDAGTDHNGTDAANQSLTTTATNRRYALIISLYKATATLDGQFTAQWKNVRTFGTHGLTKQGTAPAEGFYAADVIANAISRWAPRLSFTTGSDGTIKPTSFVIPHLAFKEQTTAAEIVKQANRFHLRDWYVRAGTQPGQPLFYYRDRGDGAHAWCARIGPSQLEENGPSVERLWNGVVVKFQDVDGTVKTVGPTGAVTTATSTDLIDTDPLNPANKLGIRKWAILDMGIVSTVAAATEVGRRFLTESKALDSSGKATITGWIEDDKGIAHPYSHIRAGDTIRFLDAADSSDRRIVKTNKKWKDRACEIDIDAPPEGMDALLERLGVVLVSLGL